MQKKINEIDFFNRFTDSGEYDIFLPSGYNKIIKKFRKLMGNRLAQGCRAIDLGCGTGEFTRKFFQKAEADLFGLDISINSVRLAIQKKGKGIHYLLGDIENLGLKEGIFDVVIFSGVLHHFAGLENCLKEGYRILKRGGCMLSYDPNIKNPFMWLYRHPSSPFYSRLGKTDNERLLSANEVISILGRIGFVHFGAYCISGVTFKYVKSHLGRLLLPFYNIIDFLLGISPLAHKYGSFLICYARK